MPKIDNYYNRFDESLGYDEILFRDGYGAQGAEQNEQQAIMNAKIAKLGRALFKDGDIVNGAQIVVDPVTGKVMATAGTIFLNGFIWNVPAGEMDIPVTGTVSVGIHLKEDIISELEDPSLRNPARGGRSEGEPGAWRRKVTARWGFDADGATGTTFYPVYTVDDGVQRAKEAPPALDSFNQAIAKYDRDSTGTGTYGVSGFSVVAGEDLPDGRQVYHLSEGRARIGGVGVEMPTSRRIIYAATPDLRNVSMEVVEATAASASENGQRVEIAHPPLSAVKSLRITVEEDVEVVHGAFQGCSDDLPFTGITAILEVRQLDTVYELETDFLKKGDQLDWSPLGAEPAAGSTYAVKLRRLKDILPEDQDLDGFTVRGAVAGTQIMFGYDQMLPRIDRMALDAEGQVTWFKGIASERNAVAPTVPDTLLAVATVYQNWRPERQVVNDLIKVVRFDEYAALQDRVAYIEQEVARNRLEMDAGTREAGARKGIFADPLLDDSMRDQGIEQTGAIVDGALTLPVISAQSLTFPEDVEDVASRPFTVRIALEQKFRTKDMQVNPYMAFDPLPAKVTLNPAIDRWTETKTNWTSGLTKFVKRNNYNTSNRSQWGWHEAQTVKTTQTVSSSTSKIYYLRQINVAFSLEGFGKGEKLKSLTFDGVNVLPSPAPVADANGRLSGSFRIPANVPAGSKSVIFQGEGGSRGTAVFVGQGTLTVTTLREVTTTYSRYYVDPLAQTFAMDRNMFLAGVDLWFTAKSSQVRVQLREVENGVPTKTVLAEKVLEPSSIVASGGGHTRILFPSPVLVESGSEYAIAILCDDAATKLAVAEMSKYDTVNKQWITSQPYTIGVLLSSSNASSWTPHQDMDLAFRLLEAEFTGGERVIDLGSVEVEEATDLVLYSLADIPSASCGVEYELTLPNGSKMTIAADQPVALPEATSGAIGVKAKLFGDGAASAMLYPGTQLLAGKAGLTGDYYARTISAKGATKATLVYDAFVPSGAAVTPEIRVDSGEWEAMTAGSATPGDDGVVEYTWTKELADANQIKIRLNLSGTLSARPYVQDIRLLATA